MWESIGALPLPGEQGAHLFAIVEGATAIGVGGLVPSSALGTQDFEVVCALMAEAQMRGFATQACQLILAWAFNTARLERVIACIDEANEGAKSVAAKLGMKALRRLGPGRTVFVRYRVDGTGP